MVQVKVFGVAVDPVTKGFVVILKDHEEKKWLPIWIGPYEAKMISLALEKTIPKRPFSPDLIKDIITTVKLEIEKIVISDLKNNTYYATIWLKDGEKQILLDARPSDAIAIALRVECPIFISDAVMRKASVAHANQEEDISIQLAQLKNQLQDEIEKENYERAAEIRDKIKDLEKEKNSPI